MQLTARVLVPALLASRTSRLECVTRGDVVRVTSDIMVKGVNANGYIGVVVEDHSVEDPEEWGACCELAFDQAPLEVRLQPMVKGYFDYGELEKLPGGSPGSEITEGDRVRVVDDVEVKGLNANGWLGTVIDAWEGCETDPACCCNELATVPFTVRLEPDEKASEAIASRASARQSDKPFVGYFQFDEVALLSSAAQSSQASGRDAPGDA